jgi:hypothetical protein
MLKQAPAKPVSDPPREARPIQAIHDFVDERKMLSLPFDAEEAKHGAFDGKRAVIIDVA